MKLSVLIRSKLSHDCCPRCRVCALSLHVAVSVNVPVFEVITGLEEIVSEMIAVLF